MGHAADLMERKGASGRLLEDFGALAQMTDLEGAPKYSGAPVLNRLGAFLLGRQGGAGKDAPLYELCHLVAAVDAAGDQRDRRLRFFHESARPTGQRLRGRLEAALAVGGWRRPGIELTGEGVVVANGGQRFCVRYGRMPFLVALFEFLAVMEGTEGENSLYFSRLDRLFDEMSARQPLLPGIKAASNEISRHLRQYRLRYLAWARHDEKFGALLRFLRDRGPDGGLTIDDDGVVAFWTAHAAGPGADFRRYRSVFDAFIDLMCALDEQGLRRSVGDSVPIGAALEQGEREPRDGDFDPDDFADWRDPFEALDDERVARINFLKKRGERAPLSLLMACGPRASRLPLSLLRAEVFGAVQAAITAGLQFKKGAVETGRGIACADAEPYREKERELRRLLSHVRRASLAAFHVLTGKDGLPGLAAAGSDDAEIPAEAVGAIAARAKEAFLGFGRKGFDAAGLDDEQHVEAFRIAAGALLAMTGQLEAYLGCLERIDKGRPDLESWFRRDRDLFSDQFEKLYGDGR